MDMEAETSSHPNSRTHQLCMAIRDNILSHFSRLREVYEENLPTSYDRLLEREVVSHEDPDRSFDNIMKQLLSTIAMLDDDSDIHCLENSCRDFLLAMRLFSLDPKKAKKSIELSRELKSNWNSLAAEMDLPNFINVETTRLEETQLLSKLKLKPLENLIIAEEHDKDEGKRLHTASDSNNKAAIAFRKYYKEIIEILVADSDGSHTETLGNTLCYQYGLIRPAKLCQIFLIPNHRIQAKAIVADVGVLIARGVIPDRHLNTFICALKHAQGEYKATFSKVIEHFRDKGYTGFDDEEVINEIDCVGGSSSSNMTIPQDNDATITDNYVRYLQEKYDDNLEPAFFNHDNNSWKFYDLSTTERSVSHSHTTTTKESDQLVLDLAKLPQKYKSHCKCRRSLIIGAPGVGKSSIVIELCKGWAKARLESLKQYRYVICIDAIQGNEVNKLDDLIKDCVPTASAKWAINQIKRVYGADTLLIFDGFDEFDETQRDGPNLFYNRLFKCKIPELRQVSLIVTARPQCANKIREYFPNAVEILGFTDSSKKEYLNDHIKNEKVKDRLSSLQPTEEFCMYIPFLLATLIEIVNNDNGQEISTTSPATLTTLYGVLIRTHVLNYVRENDLKRFLPQTSFKINLGEFASQLPYDIYIPFLKLCALAYKLVSGSSVDVVDLEKLQYTFKLVTIIDKYTNAGQKVEHKFLHSSIQEYLAAYCISRMADEDKEKSIRFLMDHFSKHGDQYHLILEFLHGFKCIKFDHLSKASCNYSNQYREITSFGVIRQLCELDSPVDIKRLYHQFNEQHKKKNKGDDMSCVLFRSWPLPSPGDFWYLGRVIALSGQYWSLGFTFQPIQDIHLKMLCEGINSAITLYSNDMNQHIGRFNKLVLSLTKVTKDSLPYIFDINHACLSHIQDLSLDNNDLIEQEAITLLSESLPKLCNLKRFMFHQNKCKKISYDEISHKDILIALSNCSSIKHVSFTYLKAEEYKLLLQMPKLQILELWHVSTSSCQALFHMLPEFKKIFEDLEIYQTEITIDCVCALRRYLPKSNLTLLKLINCDIDDPIVNELVQVIKETNSLRSDHPLMALDLCDNFITDIGGRKLLGIYGKFNIDLRETYLYNSFSDEISCELEKIYKLFHEKRQSNGEEASIYSIGKRRTVYGK